MPGDLSRTVPVIWNGIDWETVEDWTYFTSGDSVRVPKGFTHDRASVPWVLRSFFDRDSLGVAGPLVHDYLYRFHIRSRRVADRTFREIMRADGVARWRRTAAWVAVRLFGILAWRKGVAHGTR